jgi:pimeloyl-ACP methyl ester carboxylesterase
VYAPDLRGYNLSDRPRPLDAYHLRHLVADVAAIVRASGAPRAHVVGHDWGGVVAWAFAASRPDLVGRLVVINAPHMAIYLRKVWRSSQALRSWYVLFFQLPWLPERALAARDFAAIRRAFRRLSGRAPALSDEDIERFVRPLASPGALTAALNYYRANMRPDALALASGPGAADTLVIWGDRDRALGTALLDGLESFVPRVRVHRLPGIGHWVQNEAPDAVNGLLVDFFGSSS